MNFVNTPSNKVSFLLTTFNESKNIEQTLKNIEENFEYDEIIVVDDNSLDNTVEIIKKINLPKLKIYSRYEAKGFASALVLAMMNSTGHIICWMDANMGYLVKEYSKNMKLLENYDLILFSRYISGGGDKRNFLRSFPSFILNKFCYHILSKKINDYSSGLFIMKRNILNKSLPIPLGHGEFFIEFIYSLTKKNVNIKEVPFVQKEEKDSISKTAPNIKTFIYMGIKYLFRIAVTKLRN
tara:strand:- start:152 stop:868 length:717 start_codon:yes stop_codon:yes gene_type:complete